MLAPGPATPPLGGYIVSPAAEEERRGGGGGEEGRRLESNERNVSLGSLHSSLLLLLLLLLFLQSVSGFMAQLPSFLLSPHFFLALQISFFVSHGNGGWRVKRDEKIPHGDIWRSKKR